jgi:hypothetical protein
MANALPWENKEDCTLHTNEYITISTLNRAFKRLLDNDKWIERYSIILTDEKIEAPTTLTSSGKVLRLDITDGNTYYIPLYKK